MSRQLKSVKWEVVTMPSADVVIIGSGVAALSVAKAVCHEKNVILITKKTRQNNNTNLAQGGIAAAVASYDHPDDHYEDTLTAGCYYNHEEAVRYLVEQGPATMNELIERGMAFDVDEHGLHLGKEGAHRKRRVLHAGGDATGKNLLQQLLREVSPYVTIVEHEMLLHVIAEENICRGVITRDEKGETHRYGAEHVVLATGGIGSIYACTSNDESITGDGLAVAYRAGAELVDLEFVQFHPTMLYINGEGNGLVSEAVRGEGAVLINGKGERFMEHVHEQQDLAPRDVVSRAIHEQLLAGEDVYLDITNIGHFTERFPTVSALCEAQNIDITNGKIPVAPGAHFHMGGIKVNENGETSIARLYAVGEVACNGVHGANRLASNSLLEGLVFGKRTGEYILGQKTICDVNEGREITEAPVMKAFPKKQEIQQLMMKYVGIVRTEEGLLYAKEWLKQYDVYDASIQYEELTNEEITIMNMLTVCYLLTKAALERKESIGSHCRSDFPKRNKEIREIIMKKNVLELV